MFKQTFESGNLSTEIRFGETQSQTNCRDVLLFTLLEITMALLKPDNPNQDLAKSLAAVMVDTLLYEISLSFLTSGLLGLAVKLQMWKCGQDFKKEFNCSFIESNPLSRLR